MKGEERLLDEARRARVVSVQRLLDKYSIVDLKIELQKTPRPGQFLMVYSKYSEEIPMAVMDYRNDLLKIGVKAIGPSTRTLSNLICGDYVSVRGPYGSYFQTDGYAKALLIVGGIGFTPIYFLAEERKDKGLSSDILLFFRTERETVLSRLFNSLSPSVKVYADEWGIDISKILRENLRSKKFDLVAMNGPEGLVYSIWKICEESGMPCQCVLERHIKCGIGLCGSCMIEGEDISLRLCVDGPVFTSETLRKLTDFGRYEYEETGKKVSLKT